MAAHVYPLLSYRDARAAIDFIQRAFGFELEESYEEQGEVVHAELRHGESMVMVSGARSEAVERWGDHTGQGWLYVTVEDPDAHHEQAELGGAEIVSEPADQDYGSRDYSARDPEGNLWSFGTYDPLAA